MIREILMASAVILVLAGNIRYALAVYREQIQPSLVTWFLWGVAPIVTFLIQRSQGADMQSYLSLVAGISPFGIVALALVKSHFTLRLSRVDLACGLVSVAAIMAWVLTKQDTVAILLSILAGLAAGAPTAYKAFYKPNSENRSPFICGTLAAMLTILTLQQFTIETTAFPVYLAISNAIIFGLIVIRCKKAEQPESSLQAAQAQIIGLMDSRGLL